MNFGELISRLKNRPLYLRILAHIGFWMLWISLYYLSYVILEEDYNFLLAASLLFPINILIIYFTAYYLIPKFLFSQQWGKLIFWLGLSICVFLIIERANFYYIITPYVYNQPRNQPFFYFPAFFGMFVFTYVNVFLFSGVRVFRSWLAEKQVQMELEKQNLESELKLLRYQINPHFIFNTLNNIDALVYANQDRASNAIVRLSEIMRYMLYESNTQRVALDKEIYFLESMIDLIRLRLKDPDFIQFNLDGDPKGRSIPPMLLVPFVENAYKHGRKKGPSPGIIINLKITEDFYDFEVINQYDSNISPKDTLGGIGLSNLERRLDLIYKDNYHFLINNSAPTFQIYIKIPADNNSLIFIEKDKEPALIDATN